MVAFRRSGRDRPTRPPWKLVGVAFGQVHRGLDVKVVQKSLRHSSAKTTLDTYGHMWPDKEESARAAVAQVLGERLGSRTERRG